MTTVTILTQDACSSCEQAKVTLRRLGEEFPLEVSEVRMDSEEGRALVIANGIMFAPGILVDGSFFSYGRLPEKKLRKKLTEIR